MSLVSAILVWFIVMGIVKPIIYDQTRVDLNLENQDTFISRGQVFELGDIKSVSISYDVRTDQASQVKTEHFYAYVDANDYNLQSASSIPVHLEIDKDIQNLITNVRIEPQVVNVATDALSSKNFDITIQSYGNLPLGKILGPITLNPESVYVNGPEKEVEQIHSVAISIDLSHSINNFSGTSKLLFLDKNNNVLILPNTYPAIEEIAYTAMIYETKSISINALVTGEVASGYTYIGTVINKERLTVSAPRNILENLYSIDLPEININNLDTTTQYSFEISKLLPNGVKYNGLDTQIIVLVSIVDSELLNSADDSGTETTTQGDRRLIDSFTSNIIIAPKASSSETNIK